MKTRSDPLQVCLVKSLEGCGGGLLKCMSGGSKLDEHELDIAGSKASNSTDLDSLTKASA